LVGCRRAGSSRNHSSRWPQGRCGRQGSAKGAGRPGLPVPGATTQVRVAGGGAVGKTTALAHRWAQDQVGQVCGYRADESVAV
jgi:hypothetical protein